MTTLICKGYTHQGKDQIMLPHYAQANTDLIGMGTERGGTTDLVQHTQKKRHGEFKRTYKAGCLGGSVG